VINRRLTCCPIRRDLHTRRPRVLQVGPSGLRSLDLVAPVPRGTKEQVLRRLAVAGVPTGAGADMVELVVAAAVAGPAAARPGGTHRSPGRSTARACWPPCRHWPPGPAAGRDPRQGPRYT
jgi:hypothetical protein